MNEIIKAIKERRSCRKFKPDMPKREDIDAIIEAGQGITRQVIARQLPYRRVAGRF